MRAADILVRKRDGGELSRAEISAFVTGAATGGWPDYQLTALLMAVTIRGMTDRETADLTRAMAESGARVNLDRVTGVKVDKHSTGGVGDKTSLVVAPVAAACGVVVPMMSGRGLGHTGGTLDKLEAIPGFRVRLSLAEFADALSEVGCALIGPTAEVVPADRVLYALRDVTATVESIPLITASILSKKLAEGISGLVLDVKAGRGAFMPTLDGARELAESLVRVGRQNGLAVEAVLTAMDAPLGRMVGNALEVAECLDILTPGSGRPADDLSELCLHLAARMVRHARGDLNHDECLTMARQAIESGAALAKFEAVVRRQGGRWPVELPRAAATTEVAVPHSGYVTGIDARAVGDAARRLGAGRATAADAVDPAVGIEVVTAVGEKLSENKVVYRLHHRPGANLAGVTALLQSAVTASGSRPAKAPWLLGDIT